ncbi:hypothetical protein [Intestinibacter bartlettii]
MKKYKDIIYEIYKIIDKIINEKERIKIRDIEISNQTNAKTKENL